MEQKRVKMEGAFLCSFVIIIPIIVYFLIKRNLGETESVKYSDYDGIIRKYILRIQFDPKDTVAYYERGLAYLKMNDKNSAIEDLKMAATLGHRKLTK